MIDLPLIRAKISLPGRSPNLLSRPRLHEVFNKILSRRLMIVRAPAGYGKTSAVVDWAHHVAPPTQVCWYTLDETDCDPWQFLAHFIGAIARRALGFGTSSYAVLQSSGSELDPRALARVVLHDIDSHIQHPLVIVLDDYHLVNDIKPIREFVTTFLKYLGEACHLIVTCRGHIHLDDLPLLAARSQAVGCDQEALAFTADEIRNLLQRNFKLTISDAQLTDLMGTIEGWITGLLLGDPALGVGIASRIRDAETAGVDLHEYLAQQILDRQLPDVRDFLLRTSLLETFDPELCAATLGNDRDWMALIRTTQQLNLFVTPVDDTGNGLRYHHQFREFLQATAHRENSSACTSILHRLAEIYKAQQLWAQAHLVYRRLQDPSATADLVEQAGPEMIKHGQFGILNEWLTQLPTPLLQSRASLLSLQGASSSALGNVEDGLSLQTQALEMLAGQQPGELLACIRMRRVSDLRRLGRFEAALRDVEGVLILAEQGFLPKKIAAEARRVRGAILVTMGHVAAATWWLVESLQTFLELNEPAMAARVQMELAVALEGTGHYRQARRYYQQSLEHSQQVGNIRQESLLLNNLAVLAMLTGDYEQAGILLNQALILARHVGHDYSEALSLTTLADLFLDLAAFGSAEEALRQTRKIAENAKDRAQQPYIYLTQARLARLWGRPREPQRRLQEARNLISQYPTPYTQALHCLEAGRHALAEGLTTQACAELRMAAAHFDSGGQRTYSDVARLYLAAACCDSDDREAAIAELKQAFDRSDASEPSHLWLTLEPVAVESLKTLTTDPGVGHAVEELLENIEVWHQQIPIVRRNLRQRSLSLPFMPPQVAIRAFGDAEVMLNGEVIAQGEWGRLASRDLLYLLLAHPEGLSGEQVGEIFWPGATANEIESNFGKIRTRLRQVLGKDFLLEKRRVYTINTDLDYVYDVEAFESKIKAANAETDGETRIVLLQEAIALYRGPYLPAAAWEGVETLRHHLRCAFHDAVLEVATYHLEHRAPEAAVRYCEQLLTYEPAEELAHCIAMQAHAARGDRRELVRQYQRCCNALEDLGVTPSPETKALYERLTH